MFKAPLVASPPVPLLAPRRWRHRHRHRHRPPLLHIVHPRPTIHQQNGGGGQTGVR